MHERRRRTTCNYAPRRATGEPFTETSFTPQTDPNEDRSARSVHFRGQSPRPAATPPRPHRVQPLTPQGAHRPARQASVSIQRAGRGPQLALRPHGAVPGLDPVRAQPSRGDNIVGGQLTRRDQIWHSAAGHTEEHRSSECTAVPKQDVPGWITRMREVRDARNG